MNKLFQRFAEKAANLVSGSDGSSIRELARKRGAAAYFQKPVDDQALLDAIRWAMTFVIAGKPPCAK
jgi:FixJ family two-component response regulator